MLAMTIHLVTLWLSSRRPFTFLYHEIGPLSFRSNKSGHSTPNMSPNHRTVTLVPKLPKSKRRLRLDILLAVLILPPFMLTIWSVFQSADISLNHASTATLSQRMKSPLSIPKKNKSGGSTTTTTTTLADRKGTGLEPAKRISSTLLLSGSTSSKGGTASNVARRDKAVEAPLPGALFHFIHSSTETNFGVKQLKAIESVFYHHPKAQVKLWVTEMSAKPVQPFLDKGYNIALLDLDLKREVQSLLEYPEINRTIIEQFLNRWDEHTQSKLWMINNSDLFRIIVMYREGGVYMGT